MNIYVIFSLVSAVLAILYGFFLIRLIMKKSAGNEEMQSISSAISEGAKAYLHRQYITIARIAIVLFIILWIALDLSTAIGFVAGAFLSGLAGYIGMNVSVMTNVRTAEAAREGLEPALVMAFRGGAVTGLLVVGLALLGISAFFALTEGVAPLIGFGFGASLISVFARLGGGIFTKAADVGADLVGKVEAGIPEDDPRNPAVIADNVGDNVGDDAGMAADLFETYVVTTVAAMLLTSLTRPDLIVTPLTIGAVGIVASIFASFTVRINAVTRTLFSWFRGGGESGAIMGALYAGFVSAAAMAAIGFARVLPDPELAYAALIGIAVTAAMVVITEYYTSKRFRPVRAIADASASGHGTNVIPRLAY